MTKPSSFKELFPDINDVNLFKEIENKGVIKTFDDGAIIIDNGMYIKMIPLLLSGNIKVLREDEEGNELLMYYLQPGDTCTMSLTCCMAHKKSEITAVADGNVSMLAIPVEYMDQWMIKYPEWKNFVMNTYRKRFEELFTTIDQIAFKKMDERLVSYLKEKSIIKQSDVISITHHDIAKDLNSSREVISRLLKQLEKQGKVKLNRHAINIIQLD